MGGFSTVDLVVDVTTGSEFALKRIVCGDATAREKAVREMERYHLFDHHHIIECCDFVSRPSATEPGEYEVLGLFPVYVRTLG